MLFLVFVLIFIFQNLPSAQHNFLLPFEVQGQRPMICHFDGSYDNRGSKRNEALEAMDGKHTWLSE